MAAGIFAPKTDASAIWSMVKASWMNILLLCIPLGLVAGFKEMNPTLVFLAVSEQQCLRKRICWAGLLVVYLLSGSTGGVFGELVLGAPLLLKPQGLCASPAPGGTVQLVRYNWCGSRSG